MQVISFDVKPANVLLDRTGMGAKLADVGLAKVLEHSQTMTNMVGSLQRLKRSKAVPLFQILCPVMTSMEEIASSHMSWIWQ